MSFNFDLGSSEEDNDDKINEEDTLETELAKEEATTSSSSTVARMPSANDRKDGRDGLDADDDPMEWHDGDGDDDESVDWEYADEENANDKKEPENLSDWMMAAAAEARKSLMKENTEEEATEESDHATEPLSKGEHQSTIQGVTIDFDRKDEKKQANTKKKLRRFHKIKNLPPNVLSLLTNLHQSHLLALMSRSLMTSKSCSDNHVMAAAQSLIPLQILDRMNSLQALPSASESSNKRPLTPQKASTKSKRRRTASCEPADESSDSNSTLHPSREQLEEFCEWFFEFVNNVEQRRQIRQVENRAAGAPQRRPHPPRRRRASTRNQQPANAAPLESPAYRRVMWGSLMMKKRRIMAEGVGTTSPERLIEAVSYLSRLYDENPPLVPSCRGVLAPHDKVQIFVAMARSMKWRVRYVTALEPVEKDLTVHHPLLILGSLGSIFRSVQRAQQGRTLAQKAAQSNQGSNDVIEIVDNSDDNHDDDDDDGKASDTKERGGKDQKHKSSNSQIAAEPLPQRGARPREPAESMLAWAEVLCSESNHRAKASFKKSASAGATEKSSQRWVHVDPARGRLDQPLTMENQLTIARRTRSGEIDDDDDSPRKRRTGKTPVSYVLAVEHNQPTLNVDAVVANASPTEQHGLRRSLVNILDSWEPMARVSDVTPRYASAWSRTLQMRGATNTEILRSGGESADSWWTDSLKKCNLAFRKQTRQQIRQDTMAVTGTLQTRTSERKRKSVHVVTPDHATQEETPGRCKDDADAKRDHNEEVHDEDDDEDDDAVDDVDDQEELKSSKKREPIPTSKAAFKNHPVYALPSMLNSHEVLAPDASKRVCGMFKGELVYRRSDVSTANNPKKWLYKGRRVRDDQEGKPAKTVKARKRASSTKFKALDSYMGGDATADDDTENANIMKIADCYDEEGMEMLYGVWQTEKWSPPPVGPNDPIPVNKYKNVELELLNPGLVHVTLPRISLVAKRLGVPYAPCLLGFEGHGGNGTPTIRGIVVHQHNVEFLQEAQAEWESHAVEQEHEERSKAIYKRWRKLIISVITEDQLQREYGSEGKS